MMSTRKSLLLLIKLIIDRVPDTGGSSLSPHVVYNSHRIYLTSNTHETVDLYCYDRLALMSALRCCSRAAQLLFVYKNQCGVKVQCSA